MSVGRGPTSIGFPGCLADEEQMSATRLKIARGEGHQHSCCVCTCRLKLTDLEVVESLEAVDRRLGLSRRNTNVKGVSTAGV